MHRLVRHVLLPLLAPVAIVGLYFTPVTMIGCANRGLAAFGVALLALLGGTAAAMMALRSSRRLDPEWQWWALSSLILALPAALLLGPLG